ncbi:MAG: ferrous iron transport protein B [Clostridia bacterium]|nr:ferrous iron transport protein B [Clostridia bacterium]
MKFQKKSKGEVLAAEALILHKPSSNTPVIALAGNPNVGKSTVFNALTGMNQHTGNWPGKTVACAEGYCKTQEGGYVLVDLPGTYSLFAHSAEEEIARNFICFGESDAVIAVCDASCMERNLNLVLQIIESGARVVVCVNLMDEAKRRGILPDLELLSHRLGVPVVGTVAKKKPTLSHLSAVLWEEIHTPPKKFALKIPYPNAIERAIAIPEAVLEGCYTGHLEPRWLALRLLDRDESLTRKIESYLGDTFLKNPDLCRALDQAWRILDECGIDRDALQDLLSAATVSYAEELCKGVIDRKAAQWNQRDRRLDKILTGKWTAYPIMLLLLAFVFWLTVSFSNIPSAYLSNAGFWLLERLSSFLYAIGTPPWLEGALVDGALRVLVWVISVMLPPMAIFFPLFTILEDAGYLPRIAYNLDRPFQRCNACGKQALTMCMGFGCNAAGVVGCRIIDSPRERLLAILTNSFVPCNGRFPALIALLTMFFIGSKGGALGSLTAALLLTLLILLGILATLAVTKLLSVTLLRGEASAFTLELPSYRRPQIAKVLVRSLLDRTLYVLGRAVAVAAPAGLVIWILDNVTVHDATLLTHCASFLDPFAHVLGLDGVILLAFILALPANEIVLPLILMTYLANGTLTELPSLVATRELLIANGWTWATAVCVLLFFLFHWPCSTTILTVKKETGSLKWAALAALIPTALGILLCILFTATVRCF